MSQKATIKVPRTLVNQLLHLAQRSPDQEIGGLIGREGEQCTCYPIAHIEADAQKLFALHPEEQLEAVTAMQAGGQNLFAVYLSHPDTPALPPVLTESVAGYPDILHLIISLNTRGVLEMRGFQLHNQQLEEVDLIL